MRAPRKLAGCKPVHMMLHPTGQDRSGTVWKAGYEQTPTRILAFMIPIVAYQASVNAVNPGSG